MEGNIYLFHAIPGTQLCEMCSLNPALVSSIHQPLQGSDFRIFCVVTQADRRIENMYRNEWMKLCVKRWSLSLISVLMKWFCIGALQQSVKLTVQQLKCVLNLQFYLSTLHTHLYAFISFQHKHKLNSLCHRGDGMKLQQND